MQCPTCGETRVSWKNELWGSRQPQFWSKKKEIKFLCGGRFIYDEEANTYEQTHPCGSRN
jgi:hypothetical protein